jgi:hypothetical protein
MPVRESRLIAINEGERSLTAADVSAVYQINGDETKRSARNRMLANSHAGMATRLPPSWKLARPLNTSAFVGTNPTTNPLPSGLLATRDEKTRLEDSIGGDQRKLTAGTRGA